MKLEVLYKDRFKEKFLKYLKESPLLKEAFVKTYGPVMYTRQMMAINRIDNLALKMELFRFIKKMCPHLFIKDTALWEDFLEFLKSEKNHARLASILYLLYYFDAKFSVPFILNNLVIGKDTFLPIEPLISDTLIEILTLYQEEAIPYILKKAPLTYPDLARVLVPHYIRVGSGSFKTLFERLSSLFSLPEEDLIDPFINGFFDNPSVPPQTHPFLIRFFIIPSMDKYPQKRAYFLKKILACPEIESIDEHKDKIVKHIEAIFNSNNLEDIDVALSFIRRFPLKDVAPYISSLLSRFPSKRRQIFESFSYIHHRKVEEVFLSHYPIASYEEKEAMVHFLLSHPHKEFIKFLNNRFFQGDVEEKALLLRNLWMCPHQKPVDWIRYAFEEKDPYLISAALEKLHYIGNFFSKEEFNKMILTAHKMGIPINKGVLNPLTHLINQDLCREVLKSLDSFPLVIKADRLSFAGYFADEDMYHIIERYLDTPIVSNQAITAMIVSRDPRSIERITRIYNESDEETKAFISETISKYYAHSFTDIIEKEAYLYYKKMDSFTPSDAFLVPLDRKTGFGILKRLVSLGVNPSVQLMLNLAMYGGESAFEVLEELKKSKCVQEIPRKRVGLSLALYIAGVEEEQENILKFLKDDFLGNYLIYLIYHLVKSSNTYLMPSMERYHLPNLKFLVKPLFKLLNCFYPWDVVFDQIITILSYAVDEDEIGHLSRHFLGMFVSIKMPILEAMERIKSPVVLPILRDTSSLLEHINLRNIPNLPELYYRVTRLMYELGDKDKFHKLRRFYRAQIFRFLRKPIRFINTNLYFPDLAHILSLDERREVFLTYFGKYLADPGDFRFMEEALLKMIKGIKDKRFVKPIVENLRLCQRDVDLIPALRRLKELTGKTYGLEYSKWKKYLKEEGLE